MSVQGKRAYIMLISSLLIMGTIGLFRRYIPIPSELLAFCRGIIGGSVLLLFILFFVRQGLKPLSLKKLGILLLNGAFLGINWILLFEAYNYTTIAKATLCYYLAPTLVLLASPFVLGEKLTKKKLSCALLAFLGMVLVSGVLGGRETGVEDLRGICFGLGAACFYGALVLVNKSTGDVPIYEKTMIQLFASALALVPYLIFNDSLSFEGLSFELWALILFVGIIHTGLVYALYFGSMEGLRAQTISALSYLDPVTALLISALFLQEPMSIENILGAVLILGSAIISES